MKPDLERNLYQSKSESAPPEPALPRYSLDANALGGYLPEHDPESMKAIWYVITTYIQKLGGVMPQQQFLEVFSPVADKPQIRLAKIVFEQEKLITPEQRARLKTLAVEWFTSSGLRNDARMIRYPKIEPDEDDDTQWDDSMVGDYIGDCSDYMIQNTSSGVFIFRKFASKALGKQLRNTANSDTFLYDHGFTTNRGKPVGEKTIIEVRGYQRQIQLMEQVVKMSLILNNQPIPEDLWLDMYNSLLELGQRESPPSLPGTEETQFLIETLLLEAMSQNTRANSILLVGVPGGGKTELTKWAMRKATELGILAVTMSAVDYHADLAAGKSPTKSQFLHLVPTYRAKSGKRILIIVDDMELVAGHQNDVARTTLMNDLAGQGDQDYVLLGTTNFPERMTEQALNVERLNMIHCPLPTVEGRTNILDIKLPHTDSDGYPLFPSEQDRMDLIVSTAQSTDHYDPRTLSAICTNALLFREKRIAEGFEANKKYINFYLTPEDWIAAFSFVSARFAVHDLQARDKELQQFVYRFKRRTVDRPKNDEA